MVTPENFTIAAVGRSGNIYTVDGYSSDVIGAFCTLNPSGPAGTGSLTSWRCPEDVKIVDVSVITGQTVATGWVFYQNGAVRNGGVLRFTNQLSTLNNRIPLNIKFNAGDLIGLQQF